VAFKGPARLIAGIALLATLVLASRGTAGAWVVPNGQATAFQGFLVLPDPAAAGVGTYGGQIYGTYNGNNIPTETWNPVDTNDVTCCYDALPTLPGGIGAGNTWAPTVQYIGGQYVMWFVAVPPRNSGYAAEMDVATSSSALGPFTTLTAYYWSRDQADGMLDPYLYQDYHGNWWLYLSIENPSDHSQNLIYAYPLNSSGDAFVGNPTSLIDYNSMANAWSQSGGGSLGNNSYIENPAFVTDPQGTYPYNLMMSLGTWNQSNSYYTINIACNTTTGPCGWTLNELGGFHSAINQGSLNLMNEAGASVIVGSPRYDEQMFLFAAALQNESPTYRSPYFDVTNSGRLYSGQVLSAGQQLEGINYCVCLGDGWQLRMQTDGNLVIYNQNNVAQWSTGTWGGDANSYATMESSGDFEVWDDGVMRWSSHTSGNPGAYLAFQNQDGNLVVYSSTGQALWASGT